MQKSTMQVQQTTQKNQTIEDLKNELKKATNEKEALSSYFLLQQQKDFDEYSRQIENKNFYLSNSFKNECVKRWFNNNMKNITIHLTPKAGKAILGLAFLVEGYLKFEMTPQNRDTIAVIISISHEEMTNNQIYYLNNELNINIPKHEREEENTLEQEYLNSFIQSI